MRIHPSDATPRGIRSGDIVRLFNDRAQVLCIAVITHRIRPGNLHAYHAAWYDPVESGNPDSLDRGGDVNLLISNRFTSKNAPGMVNQCLVEVEKWEGDNGK